MVFITVKISIAGDGGRGEGWYGGRYCSKGGSSYSGLRIFQLSATILAKAPPSCPQLLLFQRCRLPADAGASNWTKLGGGALEPLRIGDSTQPSHSGDGGPNVAQVNLPEARQRSDGSCSAQSTGGGSLFLHFTL